MVKKNEQQNLINKYNCFKIDVTIVTSICKKPIIKIVVPKSTHFNFYSSGYISL